MLNLSYRNKTLFVTRSGPELDCDDFQVLRFIHAHTGNYGRVKPQVISAVARCIQTAAKMAPFDVKTGGRKAYKTPMNLQMSGLATFMVEYRRYM